MTFSSKLGRAQELTSSNLCVGLDPDPNRLPGHLRALPLEEAVRHFCTSIIEATQDLACAYKPNLAFFEALGRNGLGVLADVVGAVPSDRIVIADGKRGDIGNTAERYAVAAFEHLSCDACTVSPYLGREAILPFLARTDKAAYALVRTSNAGADEVQKLSVGGTPLYARMADMLAGWASGQPGEIGFVVGATDLESLEQIRTRHPAVPLLIPGVGAQGGDKAAVVAALKEGSGAVLVNASRSILYAGDGPDFAEQARASAGKLRGELGGLAHGHGLTS